MRSSAEVSVPEGLDAFVRVPFFETFLRLPKTMIGLSVERIDYPRPGV
jgi:hypothetical protein